MAADFGKMTGIFLSTMVMALMLQLMSTPVAAQFSAAYEVIKAVEDQDYTELRTKMLKCRCPNVRTVEEVPVLVIAARNSDVQIAQYLLDQGANPNIADRSTRVTALMEFARRGNLEGVAMLVGRNVDLDAGDSTGQTALVKAVRSRQIQVIRALLDAGANVDMPDYQGQTALDVARSMRLRDVERVLVNGG